jgi:hypothetical protein
MAREKTQRGGRVDAIASSLRGARGRGETRATRSTQPLTAEEFSEGMSRRKKGRKTNTRAEDASQSLEAGVPGTESLFEDSHSDGDESHIAEEEEEEEVNEAEESEYEEEEVVEEEEVDEEEEVVEVDEEEHPKKRRKSANQDFLKSIGVNAKRGQADQIADLVRNVPGFGDLLQKGQDAREQGDIGAAAGHKKKAKKKRMSGSWNIADEDEEEEGEVIERPITKVCIWSNKSSDVSSSFGFLKTWMDEMHTFTRYYIVTETMECTIVTACNTLYDLLSDRYPNQFPRHDNAAPVDFANFARKGVCAAPLALLCSVAGCI